MQVLRDTLNCSLPIEIIYNGPKEMDEWAVNKFQVTLALIPQPSCHSRLALHQAAANIMCSSL